MTNSGTNLLPQRITTFVLSGCAALSVVGWGLKLWPYSESSQPSVSAVAMPQFGASANSSSSSSSSPGGSAGSSNLQASQVASFLGAQPKVQQKAPDIALSRLSLSGLIHVGESDGVALISIDAQPPKPYRVGAKVGDTLVLSSVKDRGVSLRLYGASNEGEFRLELPKPLDRPLVANRDTAKDAAKDAAGKSNLQAQVLNQIQNQAQNRPQNQLPNQLPNQPQNFAPGVGLNPPKP